MKQGWEIKKLGEVVDIINGRNQSAVISDNGQYPIYGSAGNLMGFATDYLCKEGTTIIGRKGNISNPIYIEEKFWNVDTAFGLYPKNGYSPKFINYLCQTIDFKIRNRGTTIPSLVKSDLLTIDIPFISSPSEQQHIVSILDEAFAAIAKAKANAEQNLKNAKELFESYLKGVFEMKGDGWEERKVKDIGFAQTGTTPKTAEKENYGDFIPFIKPADVDFSSIGDIRYDNEGLSEIGLKKGRKMESGSILMVCIGATIGKVGFAEREVSCNQQINSLSVKKEFEPKFIYYAMTSKEFQEKVLLEGKGAQATLPIINKSKWENLKISFPKSKTQQKIFVDKFDALSIESQKLLGIYLKKIADLEELKKSILAKAFAGELNT